MTHEKSPKLSEVDWNRVARGGALAEAVATGPYPLGRARGGKPVRRLCNGNEALAAPVLTVEEQNGVLLEDDALVVRLAADALAGEADDGTATGRHPAAWDPWWSAWCAALDAWRWSGRPHLIVDTGALVFEGSDAICLLARTVSIARNKARDYGKGEGSVHIVGNGADLLRFREQCIEELPARERTVLRMAEAGRLYREIAEHIGISTTSTSRIYQLDQQAKQRLRNAITRRLAELVAAR